MQERRKRAGADKSNGAITDYILTEAPGHLLRRCQQRAVEIFALEMGSARLTPQQFALLLTLARRPGISQTELVAETGIDRSTVGDMIDRLMGRGLVRRRRSGRDQRANTVAILPAGIALLNEALPAVERAQQRIMTPLPAAIRAEFMAALRLMAGDVAPTEPQPARRRG
jgi:DNA-binding MarR family transcriptional regulator